MDTSLIEPVLIDVSDDDCPVVAGWLVACPVRDGRPARPADRS